MFATLFLSFCCSSRVDSQFHVNLLAPEFFFNFSTPVYKMWIMQGPNTLELWNKLHFEEKKLRVYTMFKMFSTCICWMGDRGSTVVKVLCYKSEGRFSIPAGVIGFFIDIKSFRSHYGPGVDSSSNRNEYQEYFLGVKSGRCVRLTTYHHPVPLSRNLGTLTSWNPPGLSRPVMGLLYLYLYICWINV
jgi:hypothetical protein